jgi:hypothetical protein
MKIKKCIFSVSLCFFTAIIFTLRPGPNDQGSRYGPFLDAPVWKRGTLYYLNQHGPEVLQCSGHLDDKVSGMAAYMNARRGC